MAVVEIHRHRFTVEDFAHMGDAGIFAADDRVELIDGEIREEERLLRRGNEIRSVAVAGLRLPVGEIFGARS